MYSVLRKLGKSVSKSATVETTSPSLDTDGTFYNAIMQPGWSANNYAIVEGGSNFVISTRNSTIYRVVKKIESKRITERKWLLQSLGYIPRTLTYSMDKADLSSGWSMENLFPTSIPFIFLNNYEDVSSSRQLAKFGKYSAADKKEAEQLDKELPYLINQEQALTIMQEIAAAKQEVFDNKSLRKKPAATRKAAYGKLISFAVEARLISALTEMGIISEDGEFTGKLYEVNKVHSIMPEETLNEVRKTLRSYTLSKTTRFQDIADDMSEIPMDTPILLYSSMDTSSQNPRIATVQKATKDSRATLKVGSDLESLSLRYADVLADAVTVEQRTIQLFSTNNIECK